MLTDLALSVQLLVLLIITVQGINVVKTFLLHSIERIRSPKYTSLCTGNILTHTLFTSFRMQFEIVSCSPTHITQAAKIINRSL